MPDIAVPVPAVINSGAAKKNAQREGPVGDGMVKNNDASGGAYKVDALARRAGGRLRA